MHTIPNDDFFKSNLKVKNLINTMHFDFKVLAPFDTFYDQDTKTEGRLVIQSSRGRQNLDPLRILDPQFFR